MSITNKDEASNCVQITKKSLNIPKGYSESVNRRRTDNTMAKRTNNDLQNIHIKLQERTGKCLRQVDDIRDHLWHRYSITVNQFMVETVNLSKWWLHL